MFINWNQRELHLKLVYYGPPLSGKTTNLEKIHKLVPEQHRSNLVSVKTREDRTLFFDFMQMELNEIKGLKPKFKLYTVPGQTYYEATRKLLLKDVDGLVFVADSSVKRLAANRRSMQDMQRHLAEAGLDLAEMPFVLQCNKQDVPDAVEAPLLGRFLNAATVPIVPAIATENKGIVETLKSLVNLVMARV